MTIEMAEFRCPSCSTPIEAKEKTEQFIIQLPQQQYLYSVTLEAGYDYIKPSIGVYAIVPQITVIKAIDPLDYVNEKLVQNGFNACPFIEPISLYLVSAEFITVRQGKFRYGIKLETGTEFVKLTTESYHIDVCKAADEAFSMLIKTRQRLIDIGYPAAPVCKESYKEEISQ